MSSIFTAALLQVLPGSGPSAQRIAALTWYMLAVAAFVVVIVIVATAYALFHRGHRATPETTQPNAEQSHIESSDEDRRGTRWILISGALIPAAILLFTFVVSMMTFGATDPRRGEPELTIEVTGRRWWWEVRYLGGAPTDVFATANEIRIPVGKRVNIRLESDDVIHSFWVPALQGKLDLVPGMTNLTWIQADRPGEYRGVCAEYCGVQHAKMAFLVIATMPEEFNAWIANERRQSVLPADSTALLGLNTFMTAGCAGCHTVRGTPGKGVIGPDLTHIAGRRTLAAGSLPNNAGTLTAWVTTAQALKPGSLMPNVGLEQRRLDALVHYLMSLR